MEANASLMELLEGIHDPRGARGQAGGGKSASRSESERSCQIASRLLKLVDLVIERLEADSELLGRGGIVAVVLLENGPDITRCSTIGLLPQRASLATARSEAWGTT